MESYFYKKSEYSGLKKLFARSPRSSIQKNFFNSADVEILQRDQRSFLVTSTDSLAIEIHSQLYRELSTWGYMAVANSVSDLAASGAKPLGMLISAQWKKNHFGKIKDQVYSSMAKALTDFKVPLLGGDSGSSYETVLTTTILGESSFKPLDRNGVRPGDLILSFGNFWGYGPMLAFDYLKRSGNTTLERAFRPRPEWKTTHSFRKYFNASIDSSDGIYNSLETLAIINNIQFRMDLKSLRLPKSIQSYQNKNHIPVEYFVESDLGDLQSLISISATNYTSIKNKLPYHQVIAFAEKKTARSSVIAYRNSSKKFSTYKPLPHVLEANKMVYERALNTWLAQFK